MIILIFEMQENRIKLFLRLRYFSEKQGGYSLQVIKFFQARSCRIDKKKQSCKMIIRVCKSLKASE